MATTPPLTRSLILLLAATGALGSLAIHLFVPAMPAAARDLAARPVTIQLAISLYLFGLGGGQLIAGPISDRAGRRPVLLAGAALFTLASVAAAVAPNAPALLTARLIEAVGAAAAVVAARTVVSDLSTRADAAGNLAALTGAILLSPTFAPALGGGIVSLAGWRFVFVALAVTGGLVGALAAVMVPRIARPVAAGEPVRAVYARLARNPRFRRYVAGNALASSALYVFLSGSPFLLISRYHLSPAQAGSCYLLIAATGIAGTFCVRRLAHSGDPFRTGLGSIAVGGAAMLAIALSGGDAAIWLIAPMIAVGFGAGLAAPAGISGAMHAEDGVAGTASSLAGAIQMLASAGITAAMTSLGPSGILPIAAGVCAAGTIGWLAAPRAAGSVEAVA